MSLRKPGFKLFAAVHCLAMTSAASIAGTVLDPGFGEAGITFVTPDGVAATEFRAGTALVLPDGSLLFGGSRNRFVEAAPFDPHMRATLTHLGPNGDLDSAFGGDAINPGVFELPDVVPGTQIQAIEAMRLLDDGSIVVAGTAQAFGPLTGFVAKVNAGGSMDRDFGGVGDGYLRLGGMYVHALDVDADGHIVVAGEVDVGGGLVNAAVVRLDTQGQLDTTFGGGDGIAFPGADPDRYSYINALVVVDGAIVLGGLHEAQAPETGDSYWIAKLDADGSTTISKIFRLPGSDSTFNAIQRLLPLPSGKIVFGGYHYDETMGTSVLLGRLDANLDLDTSFGSLIPGFSLLDLAPTASNRYLSALSRAADGRLIAAIDYAVAPPARQAFLVAGLTEDGAPDPGFAPGGLLEVDLAPSGVYSSSTALVLENDRPVVAGSVRRDEISTAVDLAVIRLMDDRLFGDGFDPVVTTTTTDYDDLPEGFVGTVMHSDGVTYRDLNGVAGVNPDGHAFAPGELGELFVIENATLLFDDFPAFGSAPNTLTFGNSYANGDNLSIGPLSSVRIDPDRPATAVRFEIAYYENGPWGGIEIRLEALRDGEIVGSDMLVIASDDPGHDNVATSTLAIEGAEFDALRLYATLDGVYTAPRVMIDNFEITRAAP